MPRVPCLATLFFSCVTNQCPFNKLEAGANDTRLLILRNLLQTYERQNRTTRCMPASYVQNHVQHVATSDYTFLAEPRKDRLKNPLRESWTAGSVRGEFSLSHGGLKRARSCKRWIRPKKAYSSRGLLYSEIKLCVKQELPGAETSKGSLRTPSGVGRRSCEACCLHPSRLRAVPLEATLYR